MKMFISEKSDFNNGDKPLVKDLDFDSKSTCDRNLFIQEIETWSILFRHYIKPNVKTHKKGTKIEVKVTLEF